MSRQLELNNELSNRERVKSAFSLLTQNEKEIEFRKTWIQLLLKENSNLESDRIKHPERTDNIEKKKNDNNELIKKYQKEIEDLRKK